MKKTSKYLSAVLAALMLTVAFPISAFAGTEEGTLPGDSTVKDVTVVALVPSTLAFALDPLELDATQGSQVQNANYFFVNKTEAPVLVQLDLTATTATGVTLVSDPATLSPYDTTVKTKDIYFGVLGATAVADGDLAFDYVLGTTGKTDPVGTFSSTTSPLSVFDPTTKSTKVAYWRCRFS